MLHDPPGAMRSGMLFDSEKEAQGHLANLKKNRPEIAEHSYILKPAKPATESISRAASVLSKIYAAGSD